MNVLYWALAILMFGVLVTLHELGHYLCARMSGVKVMEFAVGLGPKLFSRRAKSGVLYSLRALPFGGYCRFVGGYDEDTGAEKQEDVFALERLWKRALIFLAGPVMNILTAMTLLFLLFFLIGLPIGPEPVIGGLTPGFPAETAGLAVGDRIVRIDSESVESASRVSEIIVASDGSEIMIEVDRSGEAVTLAVRPRWVEDHADGPRYMIGFEFRMGAPVTLGLGPSLQNAVIVAGDMTRMILDLLRDLVFKGEGLDELAGPIGTMTIVKEQTQAGGLVNFVYLAAIISVNLGLFNLLPIPGLDGSKLIFLAIEKVRGRSLDPAKEGVVTLIGFGLLISMMMLTLYQDIMRLIR